MAKDGKFKGKLPKWALNHIHDLEAKILNLNRDLSDLKTEMATVIENGQTNVSYLPLASMLDGSFTCYSLPAHSRVRFALGEYKEIEVSIDDGCIRVSASKDSLLVQPVATNCVRVAVVGSVRII